MKYINSWSLGGLMFIFASVLISIHDEITGNETTLTIRVVVWVVINIYAFSRLGYER